jgi:hypothetical protein
MNGPEKAIVEISAYRDSIIAIVGPIEEGPVQTERCRHWERRADHAPYGVAGRKPAAEPNSKLDIEVESGRVVAPRRDS